MRLRHVRKQPSGAYGGFGAGNHAPSAESESLTAPGVLSSFGSVRARLCDSTRKGEEPVNALRRSVVATLAVVALALPSHPLHAEEAVSAEEMNKSNSPLNPAPAFNLQDYWSPQLYD